MSKRRSADQPGAYKRFPLSAEPRSAAVPAFRSNSSIQRPPLGALDPSRDTLIFQEIELDHSIGNVYPGMPGLQTGHVSLQLERFMHKTCPFRGGNKEGTIDAVLMVEIVKGKTLVQYHGDEDEPFAKVTVAQHKFMVDTHILGCVWIELPPKKWHLRTGKSLHSKISRCQVECDVSWADFIAHAPEGDWADVAQFRIHSFDIECAGRKGIFPEPNIDPIIQIANVIQLHGAKEVMARNIFCLNSCAPIGHAEVYCYEKEEEMLAAWADFVRELDPDIFTGYNINNFDFTYLLDRAKHLKVAKFDFLGRLLNVRSQIKETVTQTKIGKRTYKTINFEGRVPYDMLLVIKRDCKLRSYTLNSVCQNLLGEQKEDVHYSIITDLQNGDDQTRRRLAVYCLKDAELPLRLIGTVLSFTNDIEMARVTGVPITSLLTKGEQVKVVAQLLRHARQAGYFMPAHQGQAGSEQLSDDQVTTTPANCILSDDQVTTTPANCMFVISSVRPGLLPHILQHLLNKDVKDPILRNVLNGRQLAYKISANSVYGFTGAQVGKLPCLEISGSVTAYGRTMIEQTKQEVEQHYKVENGYESDAKVIYGDTDSVMVNFKVKSLEKSMELGREAAALISAKFISPIKLEFEKAPPYNRKNSQLGPIFTPYLLINKKRYAGLYFTKSDKYDKMDCKGIETVRRDNCTLVVDVINTCLQKLLIDRDPDGAVNYAKLVISDLLQNNIDISQLVITKELTKEDYAAKQAHVELAKKMKKRDPGNAPKLGDRIPYVITAATKSAKAFEKAEDPIYVLENNVPIDAKYYLENQLSKPLVRIFQPILGDNAESILLRGEHTRTRTVVTSKVGALSAFTQKKETCLGCKSVLPKGYEKEAVCPYCKPKESAIYQQELCHHRMLEDRFAALFTECQRCQGSLHEEILCTSRDCPIFYIRKKVQMELDTSKTKIGRFGDPVPEEEDELMDQDMF
ncbi:hypothetical protein YQE_01407, partial [Dendroctonus ponderosae]